MKVPVLVPCLLILLSVTVTLTGQDWSLQTNALKKSVFKLESNDGHCSSVLVNQHDNILLTAAHCIPAKAEGRSVAVDEKHADVLKHNEVLDLALVKVPGIDGNELRVRSDSTLPGLPVTIVGYGFAANRLKFGFGWVSDGRDNSLRGVGDRLYFAASGVVPGDSGGAVVDGTGRLVAIVQGGICSNGGCLAFGAPTDVVSDFLKPFAPKS